MDTPTRTFFPWEGVEVRLYGKAIGNFSRKTGEGFERVAHFGTDTGATSILAPSPATFNALVCEKKDLQEHPNGNMIHTGCEADGAVLGQPGTAFWIASADCMTTVMGHPDSCITIAAHSGRDSLVDRKRINREPSREFETVIHAN